MSISLRPTTIADLDFVTRVEQSEQHRATIGLWTRPDHEAAIAAPSMAHFMIERPVIEDPVIASPVTEFQTSQRLAHQASVVQPAKPKTQSVGYLILDDISDPHNNIQIRRIVVTEKGQGYGRQSLRLAKKLVFETYGAYRLWLDVKPYNSRAKSLYESEGFVVEGTLRDCVQLNESHDLYRDQGQRRASLTIMSLLRPEYETSKE